MPLIKAKIRLGYPPDFLPAFLLYNILEEKMKTEGITFTPACLDPSALEKRLLKGELEAGNISLISLFNVANKFAVIPFGVSAVKNTGPVLAALTDMYPKQLEGATLGLSNPASTAAFLSRLFLPPVKEEVLPAAKLVQAVKDSSVRAGLFEGQARWFYEDLGLKKVADLGEWFYEKTRLPLPENVWVIRKDLGRDVMRKVTRLLRDSLEASVRCGEEALAFAGKFAIINDAGVARLKNILQEIDPESLQMISKHTKDAIDILQKNFLKVGAITDMKKIEYVDM